MDHHLIRIDPERDAYRFYALALWPDLFGGVSFAREWGRIGQSGKLWLDHFDSEEQPGRALTRLAAAKRRRGYHAPGEAAA